MQYITFAEDMDRGEIMLYSPVRKQEIDYLKTTVIPALRPLSQDDYASGPAAILQTEVRSSYVLDRETAYWCAEWPPGLLVLQFTADGPLQWAAFPASKSNAVDLERSYNEADDEPQFRLVYEAWDAQFEDGVRDGWKEADERLFECFETALTQVRIIEDELEQQYGNDEAAFARWMQTCEQSPIWKGTAS